MIPILMMTHNRLEFTKQAIKALMEHTHEKYMLMLFDNGSEDDTPKWLMRLAGQNVAIYCSPVNVGINGAMDFFHQHFGRTEFYAKVDNDTIVPDGWLEDLMACLEGEKADLVGSIHHTFSKGAFEAMVLAKENGYAPFASPGGSGILYRKKFVNGYWLSNLKADAMSGWTHHCWRMKQIGKKAGFCGGVELELLDMVGHFKRKEGVEGWRGF